ncbi:MAG: hypothetical protein EOP45_06280 [Sphingobacteriaceae bacterium]|nr:MAG: hypothetical protein EOP45_06280 [Sphingobacteriaceae bacterium]
MSILLITNKQDITTDFRLNTEDIGRSIDLTFDFIDNRFFLLDGYQGKTIDLLQIKSVYYRRPEIGFYDEGLSDGEARFVRAELLYTLEGLYQILDHARWLNKVQPIRNAENKIYQLLLAKRIGFQMPASIITNEPKQALHFYEQQNESCIIKPIKSGLVGGAKEEGVIFTSRLLLNNENALRIKHCPTYIQTLIPKRTDIRVTVVGNRVFAAKIHSQNDQESSVDWRKSEVPLPHSSFQLPEELEEKCKTLVKALDLQYGAIDFIEDTDGNFVFLEINPNGQWAWIENRLNLNISDAITEYLAGGEMVYST